MVHKYQHIRPLLLLALLFFCINLQAQTFSKVYDLDTMGIRNYCRNMIVDDNHIYMLSAHFCDRDTAFSECAILGKYNLNGEVLIKVENDSILAISAGLEGLKIQNETIYHSVNHPKDKFRNSYMYEYDLNLNNLNITRYPEDNTQSNVDNEGLTIIGDRTYLYGSIRNDANTPDSVYVIQVDEHRNELRRSYYSYGTANLDINNVQATPDGHLAFILEITPPPGIPNGFLGYQLMKIDTLGVVVDSFAFEDHNRQPSRLLATSDGSYYFSSHYHPVTESDIFTTGYGLVNKLHPNMDSLEWTIILPNEQLDDGRNYRIHDYIETANGDIVVCGQTLDNTDTELATGIGDKHTTFNGFMMRVNPKGQTVWYRLYKIENDLLPHDEYGRFRPSVLNKVKELPNGNIVASGGVYVNNLQYAAINEFETEAFHLWLLVVDANGCVEGEECHEIVRLDGQMQQAEQPFPVGTRWTYEYFPTPVNPNSVVHSYITYEVYDSTLVNDTMVYFISNNRGLPEERIIQDDSKVWFWDEQLQDWQLTYDFHTNIGYPTQFGTPDFLTTVDAVVLDTFELHYFGERGLQNIRHISVFPNGTLEEPLVKRILDECGSMEGGLRLGLALNLWDPFYQIGEIRCFESGNFYHNFNDTPLITFPCDSMWTEIPISTNTPKNKGVRIYPNPTKDVVFVEGVASNSAYELFTIDGVKVRAGMLENNILDKLPDGVSVLKIKVGTEWQVLKVVKVE